MANPSRFVIDWPELKQITLRLLAGNTSDFKRKHNGADGLNDVTGGDWRGFSSGQLERWLKEGFKTDAIHGLEDFIPPIREKRRFVFSEEGDEFHYDIAAGGSENYMSHFTKRDEIPGLAIDVEIAISGSTSSDVVNAYFTWICRVAFAVESAGIDTEITLTNSTHSMLGSGGGKHRSSIRVKRENEATDFLSWSPMLSPASLRCFGFIAQALHADSEGANISSSHGSCDTPDEWSVKFIPESRTIKISPPHYAQSFPEAAMIEKLRAALKEATASLS